MPVYSVNRRRAIVLLVLSSVLLITLDLRGNPLFDRLRSAFSDVLTPFETAGDVIATPIRNAWHGATDYQDLKRQNDELRDEIAQQRGDQLAARASYSDLQDLLALNGLVANYLRVTAGIAWTQDWYRINSTAGGAATLSSSPAAVGLMSGSYVVGGALVSPGQAGAAIALASTGGQTLHIKAGNYIKMRFFFKARNRP